MYPRRPNLTTPDGYANMKETESALLFVSMTFCLNPQCQKPHNLQRAQFCQTCGSQLLLGDRYRAIKPIGAGGFGKTFLGIDEYKPSKPCCAIKQFTPNLDSARTAQKASQLFLQEAVQLEQLGQHPQIPDLLAHFEQEGRQYLVQEFIEGQNLAEELTQEGTFNETQIRSLLNNLLPVLQFVHDRQVIHRDIKPENIIHRHSDGQLVLVDFGAAKIATATSLARTGTIIGSAGYAAPEQALGKATFASDLYSLGITCIHLLTQIEPFDLFDTREGRWVWRDYLVNNPVSEHLGRILDKLLENAIARRYQTAQEVLKDLNQPRNPVVISETSEVQSVSHSSVHNYSQQSLTELRPDAVQKRVGTSYLLWAIGLCGLGGLHRFYNGKVFTGLLWFCTGSLFGVGQVVDIFLIPGMAEEQQAKIRRRLGFSSAGVPLEPQNAIAQTLPNSRDRLMVKLVKAAQLRGGKLSVTQAVMDTDVSFSEVEEALTQMVSAGYVSVENDPVTGVVIYRFDEL